MPAVKLNYRLGLDQGTNSIGWAIVPLDAQGEPTGCIELGSHIFPDGRNPKDKSSLAVARREARSARRRRDRFVARREQLMRALIRHGLMPQDERARKALEGLDPIHLRVRALDERIELHELGRALFHLNQRRGFKSNRKADTVEKDQSLMKEAIAKLRAQMADEGCETYGQFLAKRHERREGTRARPHQVLASKKTTSTDDGQQEAQKGGTFKNAWDFYPDRTMIELEFDRLITKQREFHGAALHDAAVANLRAIIFHQRPLKPVKPGKCTLYSNEERAPWALPSAQRFRMLKELSNLNIRLPDESRKRPLTLAERDSLFKAMSQGGKELSFDKMRKLLGLPSEARFSLEDEKRKALKCDETASLLASKGCLGKAWLKLTLEAQDGIVEKLLADEDEEALIDFLEDRLDIENDMALKLSRLSLPKGHLKFSRKALAQLLPLMEEETAEEIDKKTGEIKSLEQPIREHEATRRLGFDHSDQRLYDEDGNPRRLNRLPYYGLLLQDSVAFGSNKPKDPLEKRVGKIANPTVHIALNQLRKLVNGLIDRFGPPEEIHLEMARDLKQSKEDREKDQKNQKENQAKNLRAIKRLQTEPEFGISLPSRDDVLKIRLWEEQSRGGAHLCPYCLKPISQTELFKNAEVDHILPWAMTLDDGRGNKVVAHSHCNRHKARQTPHGAFGHQDNWPDILAFAEQTLGKRAWRFYPDAMERWENDEKGFLARQLNDTRYIAKIARRYLSAVCDYDKIITPNGRMTSLLRGRWGFHSLLNTHNREGGEEWWTDEAREKKRTDHRHHAIDALTIALTSRSMLQRIQTNAAKTNKEGRNDERLIEFVPKDPWPGYDRAALQAKVNAVIVTHKPDHGHQGALHNDTAYGVLVEEFGDKKSLVWHHKPLTAIKDMAKLDEYLGAYHAYAQALKDKPGMDRPRAKIEGVIASFENLKSELGPRLDRGLAWAAAIEDYWKTGAPNDKARAQRRVAIIETLAVKPIRKRAASGNGEVYRAVKTDGNYCFVVTMDKKGKWKGETISRFDANQMKQPQAAQPNEVMRLYINDLIMIEKEGTIMTFRVVKLSGGKVTLVEPHEAGDLKRRDANKEDPLKYWSPGASTLQELKARRVHVTLEGRRWSLPIKDSKAAAAE